MTPENAQNEPALSAGHQTSPPVRKSFSWRRLGSAVFGTVLIGVILPCVLTWIAMYGGGQVSATNGLESLSQFQWNFEELFVLILMALALCSEGAVVLALFLYFIFRKTRTMKEESERSAIRVGMIVGALTSFLNLPGFLVFLFLEHYPLAYLRVFLLFLVTGASCGAWIAWQAYREGHPERKFIPRFTMGTLLVLLIAWGALLLVFMPRPKPYVKPDPNANQMM